MIPSRTYYFDATSFDLRSGDSVVVETERGSDIAVVVIAPHQVSQTTLEGEIKPIVRIATADDLELAASLRESRGSAGGVC